MKDPKQDRIQKWSKHLTNNYTFNTVKKKQISLEYKKSFLILKKKRNYFQIFNSEPLNTQKKTKNKPFCMTFERRKENLNYKLKNS